MRKVGHFTKQNLGKMKGTYKELVVWQKAHALTLEIYNISKDFDSSEKFGITSQLRRAAVSIELNIVEGKYRNTAKEFAQFLYTSRASNQEVHCLLLICKDLNMISEKDHKKLTNHCDDTGKMLNGLIKSIKNG